VSASRIKPIRRARNKVKDMSMNEQILRSELSYRVEQGRGRYSSWSRVEGRTEPVLVRRGWRKVRTVIGR
jgi:hypothetical protein